MTPLLAQRLRTDRSFERLYRRHVADVYHYALAVCRNGPDAEDVTQTTFMNAYRAVQAGEEPRAPKNWLLTIAHNVLRQRFRTTARRPDEVELDDDVTAGVPDDEGYSAEDIRRALGELAFNQRAALVMRELEGRTYSEIAEILGLSVGAVETLIFRARRALREQLEGSLTCHEAELAISRQLDGRLSRSEKGALRAHLRICNECATFARSQRAQRAALKGLAAIPLPASLTSLFGGGGAAATAVATKAVAATALGLLVAGGTVATARHERDRAPRAAAPAAATEQQLSPSADAVAPTPVALDRPTVVPPRAEPVRGHSSAAKAKHAARRSHRVVLPVVRPATPRAKTPTVVPGSHPVHPAHPVKPAHPVHPTHPVHPAAPATSKRAAAPGHSKPARAHATPAKKPTKPEKPARPEKPAKAEAPPPAPPAPQKPSDPAPPAKPEEHPQAPPAAGNGKKSGTVSALVPIDLGLPLP